MKIKNAFQMKLIVLLSEFSLKHKFDEAVECMKILNKHLTRHYINVYWKLIFQLAKCKLKLSHDTMPQFLDCLKTFRLTTYNEILYSYVCLLFSENKFDLANDTLKMIQFSYSQTDSITPLITLLKGIIDFIQWKVIITSSLADTEKEYVEQLAERCIFQFRESISHFQIADVQLIKISEILIYYKKIDELNVLLKENVEKNKNYINAYKYLYKFQEVYDPNSSIFTLQKVVELVPSDSLVLQYCEKLLKRDNYITCIDSIFDMLDYAEWKYDCVPWKFFANVLLKIDRDDIKLKECIMGNWNIRKSYWPFYHFRKYQPSEINSIKVIIAAILIGRKCEFVKKAKKCPNIDKASLISALEIHIYLNETS